MISHYRSFFGLQCEPFRRFTITGTIYPAVSWPLPDVEHRHFKCGSRAVYDRSHLLSARRHSISSGYTVAESRRRDIVPMGNSRLYRSADGASVSRWSAIGRAAELRRKAQAERIAYGDRKNKASQ